MAIQRLAIISVPVSDQERAKRFYTEVLGFIAGRDSAFRDNARWIEVRPTADSPVTLTLVTWFPSLPPGCLRGLVLLADDLEATCEQLQQRGLSSASAIQSAPWGRYVTFSDPDGNGWVLQEARAGV
jgi:catechol 2,3-dioxygenase-like lactoylglutathione lyase family enzyme